MQLIGRLTVWAIEVVLQAVLIGLLLVWLFGHDRYSLARGLLIYIDSILVMFFLTGYLLTTAISRALWRGHIPWIYSVIATALFTFHFELLNFGIGGAFESRDRARILFIGAFFAFLTTLSGSAVLLRWTMQRDPRLIR